MKWLYWHLIVWVDPDLHDLKACPGQVGTMIGLGEIRDAWPTHDPVKRGFYDAAELIFLGKLPATLHEEYPREAEARLNLWKALYHAER